MSKEYSWGFSNLQQASWGSWDVVWPASSTDNAIARYDWTTWKLLQNSWVTINDNWDITGNAVTLSKTWASTLLDLTQSWSWISLNINNSWSWSLIVVDTSKLVLDNSWNLSIWTATANQKLTLEWTMSFKEQASANADTASYWQLWVKSDTPNTLWFTNDAWTDFQVSPTIESMVIYCSDETTVLTTWTAKVTFRMPYAFTLTAVRASLTWAWSTSWTTTVDINESWTTILSTKLTIDQWEKTSTTAATAAVISDSALADDAEITIDIDAVTGWANETGLKVYLIWYRS